MWPGTEEARAIDHVSFALKKRLQEERIFCRVVLEVCVLNDDEIASSFRNPPAEGRALSLVLRLKEHSYLWVRSQEVGEDFARTVSRTVIDAKQFDFQRCGQNSLNHRAQGGALVIHGHDYGEFHAVRNSLRQSASSRMGPSGRLDRLSPVWVTVTMVLCVNKFYLLSTWECILQSCTLNLSL